MTDETLRGQIQELVSKFLEPTSPPYWDDGAYLNNVDGFMKELFTLLRVSDDPSWRSDLPREWFP